MSNNRQGTNAPHGEPETTSIQMVAEVLSHAASHKLSPEETAAVSALPPRTALLVAHDGAGGGSRFLLDRDEVPAGRHPSSEIFLDDVTVSRRHARFVRRGDTFEVIDTGSLNGTYVNGDRVDNAVLDNGDEVQIGKFRFTFYRSLRPQSDQ
ncbi:FHA domain-containing protein [Kocuria sp. M1R5S2]|uniref:FHA domain-containing protein n=1 Tax=Kocuria rhizosphaerae TaxID=3376285 RepID=UPI0037B237BA